LQSRPVAVDISHYKNAHWQLLLLKTACTFVIVDCSPSWPAEKNPLCA